VIKRTKEEAMSMNMGDKYEIPQDVLELLKDDEKTLSVNFDDFSLLVDGTKMGEALEDFDGLDVGFSMDKDEGLSAQFDGKDVFQLHFNHHGALPCPLIYKMKAEGYSPGDELYLYYQYEESGIIEAKMKVVVDAEGYITFQIYHCSSYVLTDEIIEDAVGNYGLAAVDASVLEAAQAAETPTPTPAPTDEPTASPTPAIPSTPTPQNTDEGSADAGVPHPIYILSLLGIALISSAITAMVMKSRQNKKEKADK
jgi:hypothetical protein